MDIKPIYSKESDSMEKQLHNFVSEHNLLADILNVFNENDTAKQFFEEAREEVLESGNCGLNTMYVIALRNLIAKVEAYMEEEWDETNVDKLNSQIWQLERENRVLNAKLDKLSEILKGE